MSNLQKMRNKRGLSQSQLAKAANINVRTLQNYEQNERDINGAKITTLIDVSKALNCKISDILSDEELIRKCKELGV